MSEWKGTLELNEPLSVEIMAKITDAEYENTERLLITTPSGKKVEFIKADAFRWIPVSERLPKENGYYLTTTMYHEVYCDYWEEERFNRTETVIAWMPLPEPYKEENEEVCG